MAKQKMSKKKKIVIIVVSILAFLLVVVLAGGLIALNWYCQDIEPLDTVSITEAATAEGKDIKLIAHRGLSGQAPENTIPAVTLAGEYGYWGTECDIYRTKDGRWVLMHDNYLIRMMKGAVFQKVESMTYNELMEYVYDNGANIDDYPGLKVCTLEEYLDECIRVNVMPVIEYKSKKNYEYIGEVMQILREKGMEENCVIISFQIDALIEFRKHTNIVPLYYLMSEITEEKIQAAADLGNSGINFNANNDKNTKELFGKAVTATDLEAVCYTVDEIDKVNEMIGWGVTIFTTNRIVPVAG